MGPTDFDPDLYLQIPVDEYLKPKQVMSILGIGKTTLHRWVQEGTFPAPIRLGKSVVRWSPRQLITHIAVRNTMQDTDAAKRKRGRPRKILLSDITPPLDKKKT